MAEPFVEAGEQSRALGNGAGLIHEAWAEH